MFYRGLSGIDCALFGLVVTDLLKVGWRERHGFSLAVGGLTLAGFMAKSIFELTTGDTVFVETAGAFAPVPLAHLLGVMAGAAAGLALNSNPQKEARRANFFRSPHAVHRP